MNNSEIRFPFGENWTDFLNILSDEHISEAEKALAGFINQSDFERQTLFRSYFKNDKLALKPKLGASQWTFVVAKKGAQGWQKPNGARVQSSWQWQMALVFLSPYPLEVLRRKVPFRV
ncbi:MAG: hypothetical protein Fur0017_19540 [Anaerolineales bacterium]